jgi:prepilin-type N-terminal cleavage/methylation domain-containing protein
MTSATSPRSAFTLIELLVVIAIIALLMGLLFPAVTGAIQTAKRNQARADAQQIASAVTIFWNDYGRLPVPDGENSSEDDAANFTESLSRDIVAILIGANTAVNPRNKGYLEIDTAADDGTYLDPWGNQYLIKLDRDANNKVQYGSNSDSFGVRAVVVSSGKDGDPGTLADNVSNVDFED